jgi:hypothetical protein
MPRREPGQRIMTFEEFMRVPRSKAEISAYRGALAAAQALGGVDEDLNVIGPVRSPADGATR